MTSKKLEYDAAIGGNVTLPEDVQTYSYAASRVNEIRDLLRSIENPTSTKLIFQTLPKHMRRRAMSHHPNRLPRRYRSIHKSQMSKSGTPKQSKRPSRKYRRKPTNLLKEFTRRQKQHKWLETHIWHAKRFHMVSKWGYKLPLESCNKTFRACYRATTHHCLLQDISYYCCLEIKGEVEVIRTAFKLITSDKCGLGIAAKGYTTGKREGSINLFRINKYPRNSLGKVSFLWKTDDNILEKVLWLFVHPSTYQEILEELIKLFELVSCKTIQIPIKDENKINEIAAEENENESKEIAAEENKNQSKEITAEEKESEKIAAEEKENKKIEVKANIEQTSTQSDDKKTTQLKFITKTFAYLKNPKYENKNSGIILTELKDTINRFRLTGPLSQAILTNAFIPKKFTSSEPENWFRASMTNTKNIDAHSLQTYYWKKSINIKSPGELIPHTVLGLNIEDPRINRPNKRTKAITPISADIFSSMYSQLPENLSYSSIWDFDLRNSFAETMISTNKLCEMRNKECMVPGKRCQFENDLQPIPILLIQRPGSQQNQYKRLGFGCGWDVIIPSGYGVPVWLSLIMWGAKPGGLREMKSIHKESGVDEFLPDTVSGLKESGQRYMALREKYFRLPPNKRCNYRKFSICSPFRAPLNQLVKEWCPGDYQGFYVVRDQEILSEILNSVQNNSPLPNVEKGCLIQISIKMKTRGNPGDFSLICMPQKKDFRQNLRRLQKLSNDPVYTEELAKDQFEAERKLLRNHHKKLLKRLRGQRVREKKKKQETSKLRVKIRPAKTSHLVQEQFKKMCKLWLDDNPVTIRNQCSREVFGYITQCDFSMIEATVTGVGYITYEGLEKFLRIFNGRGEKIVLVRGTKSRHYRFSTFKINRHV